MCVSEATSERDDDGRPFKRVGMAYLVNNDEIEIPRRKLVVASTAFIRFFAADRKITGVVDKTIYRAYKTREV